jgi:hypothetical protein
MSSLDNLSNKEIYERALSGDNEARQLTMQLSNQVLQKAMPAVQRGLIIEAVPLLEQASELGHPMAMLILSDYYSGFNGGLPVPESEQSNKATVIRYKPPVDANKAIEQYKRLLDKRNAISGDCAEAKFGLGAAYLNGLLGQSINLDEGYRLMDEAWDTWDSENAKNPKYPFFVNNLGTFFYNRTRLTRGKLDRSVSIKDYERAEKYLRIANRNNKDGLRALYKENLRAIYRAQGVSEREEDALLRLNLSMLTESRNAISEPNRQPLKLTDLSRDEKINLLSDFAKKQNSDFNYAGDEPNKYCDFIQVYKDMSEDEALKAAADNTIGINIRSAFLSAIYMRPEYVFGNDAVLSSGFVAGEYKKQFVLMNIGHAFSGDVKLLDYIQSELKKVRELTEIEAECGGIDISSTSWFDVAKQIEKAAEELSKESNTKVGESGVSGENDGTTEAVSIPERSKDNQPNSTGHSYKLGKPDYLNLCKLIVGIWNQQIEELQSELADLEEQLSDVKKEFSRDNSSKIISLQHEKSNMRNMISTLTINLSSTSYDDPARSFWQANLEGAYSALNQIESEIKAIALKKSNSEDNKKRLEYEINQIKQAIRKLRSKLSMNTNDKLNAFLKEIKNEFHDCVTIEDYQEVLKSAQEMIKYGYSPAVSFVEQCERKISEIQAAELIKQREEKYKQLCDEMIKIRRDSLEFERLGKEFQALGNEEHLRQKADECFKIAQEIRENRKRLTKRLGQLNARAFELDKRKKTLQSSIADELLDLSAQYKELSQEFSDSELKSESLNCENKADTLKDRALAITELKKLFSELTKSFEQLVLINSLSLKLKSSLQLKIFFDDLANDLGEHNLTADKKAAEEYADKCSKIISSVQAQLKRRRNITIVITSMVVIVIAVVLLMNQKGTSSDGESPDNTISGTPSESNPIDQATASPRNDENELSPDIDVDWQALYLDFFTNTQNSNYNDLNENGRPDNPMSYAIADLNFDGIPEVLMRTTDDIDGFSMNSVFTILNNQVFHFFNLHGGYGTPKVYLDNQGNQTFILEYLSGDGGDDWVSIYAFGNKLIFDRFYEGYSYETETSDMPFIANYSYSYGYIESPDGELKEVYADIDVTTPSGSQHYDHLTYDELDAMKADWLKGYTLVDYTVPVLKIEYGSQVTAQQFEKFLYGYSLKREATESFSQPQTLDGTFCYELNPYVEFTLTGLQPNCIAAGHIVEMPYGFNYILVFDDNGTITFLTDVIVGVSDEAPRYKAGEVYNISDLNGLLLDFYSDVGFGLIITTETKLSGLIESYGGFYSPIIYDVPVEDVLTAGAGEPQESNEAKTADSGIDMIMLDDGYWLYTNSSFGIECPIPPGFEQSEYTISDNSLNIGFSDGNATVEITVDRTDATSAKQQLDTELSTADAKAGYLMYSDYGESWYASGLSYDEIKTITFTKGFVKNGWAARLFVTYPGTTDDHFGYYFDCIDVMEQSSQRRFAFSRN